MDTPWSERWGTLYMVMAGARPVARDQWVRLLGPVLRARGLASSQYPSVVSLTPRMQIQEEEERFDEPGSSVVVSSTTVQIVDGPFRGDFVDEGQPFVSAMKWNLRTAEDAPMTRDLTRMVSRQITSDALPWFEGEVFHRSFLPAAMFRSLSSRATGDRGVPATPPLPPAPVAAPAEEAGGGRRWGWWLAAAAAGVGLYAMSRS